MRQLLHDLHSRTADSCPDAPALRHRGMTLSYSTFSSPVEACAAGLVRLGLERQERVALFLPKQFETVVAMFGAAQAGLIFVPVNPVLKGAQVEHILRDCNVRVLITSEERAATLEASLSHCPDLAHLVLINPKNESPPDTAEPRRSSWAELLSQSEGGTHRVIDTDVAAILYTSGSTGKPKGVVLSHRYMVAGAHSVAEYLQYTRADRLLAVLPFSFDYGFGEF